MSAQKKIQVVQTRSVIGQPADQRRTLQALGLGRIGRVVQHNDSPDIRGMLRKVSHLIEIEATE